MISVIGDGITGYKKEGKRREKGELIKARPSMSNERHSRWHLLAKSLGFPGHPTVVFDLQST